MLQHNEQQGILYEESLQHSKHMHHYRNKNQYAGLCGLVSVSLVMQGIFVSYYPSVYAEALGKKAVRTK